MCKLACLALLCVHVSKFVYLHICFVFIQQRRHQRALASLLLLYAARALVYYSRDSDCWLVAKIPSAASRAALVSNNTFAMSQNHLSYSLSRAVEITAPFYYQVIKEGNRCDVVFDQHCRKDACQPYCLHKQQRASECVFRVDRK